MAAPNLPFVENIRELYQKLTNRQKVLLGVFSAVVLGVVILLVALLNTREYAVLYSGLSSEDSSAVVGRLKEMKVEYRLADNGQTVEVPADQLDEVRIQVAGDGGLQSGKMGFELFDKNSFGVTDFQQKINLRRALEGELARTISRMKEVKAARVHLVIPEERLFKEDEEKAKASVVLAMKAGQNLNREQVSGVGYLIASAVPGLKAEQVTVLDDTGRILSLPESDDAPQMLSKSQEEYRRNLEKEYERKVRETLMPIVGDGRVKTNVSVALNLNRIEQTSEVFDPARSAVSQSNKSEEFYPDSRLAGGVAGTRSNTPVQPAAGGQPAPAALAQANAVQGQRIRNQESMSYQVSRTLRKEIFQPGTVEKLSVAVIIDNRLQTVKDQAGQPAYKFTPWKQEELDNMRTLTAAAVGLDQNRGDVLTVSNIPFFSESELAPLAEPGFLERYSHLIPVTLRYLGLFLLFAILYFLLIRPMKKRVFGILDVHVKAPGMVPLAAGAGTGAAAVLEAAPQAAMLKGQEGPPEPSAEEIETELASQLMRSQNAKSVQLQKILQKEIKDKPEKMANVIRAWLVE